MSTISVLPNEVLLQIFEHLGYSSPSDLLRLMLCCPSWHHLTTSALYKNVSLECRPRDDSQALRFFRQLQPYSVSIVRSLNLHFSQSLLISLRNQTRESVERICELRRGVVRLENLKAFSLSMEQPRYQGFPVPTGVITGLLGSISMTVVDVDLNCESCYGSSVPQPHLCESLSALLPRLKRLRLRLSHLCYHLFDSIDNEDGNNLCSALEYAVIRLDLPTYLNSETMTRECYSPKTRVRAEQLGNHLQRLRDKGRLPQLRRFTIIERIDATNSPHNDQWNVFKVRDLTQSTATTTTFPWCARGGTSSLYMIRDEDGDWFGSFDNLTKNLEGPYTWWNQAADTRLSRQNSLENGVEDLPPISWPLSHSQLLPRQQAIDNFGVSFRIWKHEAMTNMRLLDVRTARGFEDTLGVSEVLPAGWTWVAGGPWGSTIERVGS
jgi:hypothetical protein